MGERAVRLEVAAFDALASEAAVLDGDGVVLLVNEAWREFGRQNGAGVRSKSDNTSPTAVSAFSPPESW